MLRKMVPKNSDEQKKRFSIFSFQKYISHQVIHANYRVDSL